MPTIWNIIEGLQLDIRKERKAAKVAAQRISEARNAGDVAKCHENEIELRRIVTRTHDARRALEVIWPSALTAVEDDLDYIYTRGLSFDPSAMDRLAERIGAREIAAVRVMSGHIAAAELSRLSGPINSAHARYRLDDAQDELDYLYLEWRKATGEMFSPDVWPRLDLLDFRAISRKNKNENEIENDS